mgnify:CR=1 FL=1
MGGFLWPVGVPVLGVRAVGGGFCGGHGPGVTPGPFPNPEAKAWHGDGTAPGRVWESNTPPQAFLSGFPVEPTLRETPPFFIPFLTESPWTDWPPREDSFSRSPAVCHRGLQRLLSQRGLIVLSRGPSRKSTSARPQIQCLAIGCLPTVVPVTSLFSYLRRKSTSDAFFLMLGIVGRLRAYVR